MHEGLAQWDYVAAAYALGVSGTLGLVTWAWTSMLRAEKRRDAARGR